MTSRSDRGSNKPRGAERFERVDLIRDSICGLHQGQQPFGAARTGRTHGCTRPVLIAAQKPLAPWGPSTHGSTTISLHSYAGAGAVHSIRSRYLAVSERAKAGSTQRPHALRIICKQWTTEPKRFKLGPLHQMPGLKHLGKRVEAPFHRCEANQ